jgi:hypothetical protein
VNPYIAGCDSHAAAKNHPHVFTMSSSDSKPSDSTISIQLAQPTGTTSSEYSVKIANKDSPQNSELDKLERGTGIIRFISETFGFVVVDGGSGSLYFSLADLAPDTMAKLNDAPLMRGDRISYSVLPPGKEGIFILDRSIHSHPEKAKAINIKLVKRSRQGASAGGGGGKSSVGSWAPPSVEEERLRDEEGAEQARRAYASLAHSGQQQGSSAAHPQSGSRGTSSAFLPEDSGGGWTFPSRSSSRSSSFSTAAAMNPQAQAPRPSFANMAKVPASSSSGLASNPGAFDGSGEGGEELLDFGWSTDLLNETLIDQRGAETVHTSYLDLGHPGQQPWQSGYPASRHPQYQTPPSGYHPPSQHPSWAQGPSYLRYEYGQPPLYSALGSYYAHPHQQALQPQKQSSQQPSQPQQQPSTYQQQQQQHPAPKW